MHKKFLPSTAWVTPKGIRYQNLYYTFPGAISERWFEFSRIIGPWKIRVFFNQLNFNLVVYLKDGREEILELCTQINQNE